MKKMIVKIVKTYKIKKKLFCINKMVNTSVETWEEAGVKVVVYKNVIKWLKMCGIQSGLGVKNMSDLALKEIEGIYGKKGKNLKKTKLKNIKQGLVIILFTLL